MSADRSDRVLSNGMLTVRIGAGPDRTIDLRGELDMSNAAALSTALEEVEATGAKTITVDMRELEFIDSTGIAVLVSAHHRLANRDGQIRLIRSRSSAVRRVMEVTGLDRELLFVDDEQAAGANGPD